ncbi:MAG TPA: hypothetical protein VNO70_03295 [Blastocatellia bacterium]|nr:hypothetical protein [Blastocatellia bacterium]
MKKSKRHSSNMHFIIGAVLFLAMTISTSLWSLSASPHVKKNQIQVDEENKIPVAIDAISKITEPAELNLRIKRNSRYDNRHYRPLNELPSEAQVHFISNHWWVDLPAIPAVESDAVVLGKVIDAKGYLSNDKTGAYSEFTVHVKDVLKNHASNPLVPSNLIVAEREGAIVKTRFGNTVHMGIAGQRMPQIERDYVFFLKYISEAQTYHIITGYEIRKERIFPLDKDIEQFAAYKGHSKTAFLEEVRQAIINPPQTPRR